MWKNNCLILVFYSRFGFHDGRIRLRALELLQIKKKIKLMERAQCGVPCQMCTAWNVRCQTTTAAKDVGFRATRSTQKFWCLTAPITQNSLYQTKTMQVPENHRSLVGVSNTVLDERIGGGKKLVTYKKHTDIF